MITTSQIVDAVLPLTKADLRCGFQKAKKLKERAYLIMLINYYKEGMNVTLPEPVLKLLHGEDSRCNTNNTFDYSTGIIL
jgi:hypothetical protein